MSVNCLSFWKFDSQDAVELLEKRVKSRFSNRKLLFLPPPAENLFKLSLPLYFQLMACNYLAFLFLFP